MLTKQIILIFLALVLGATMVAAYSEVEWTRPLLRGQTEATGSVSAYTNDSLMNYIGFCVEYDNNINVRTPTPNDTWLINGDGDFWRWENTTIAKKYDALEVWQGEWLYLNQTNREICYFKNSQTNTSGNLYMNTLDNIPALIDYPTAETELNISMDFFWCSANSTPTSPYGLCQGTDRHLLGNAVYSYVPQHYNFSGCEGYPFGYLDESNNYVYGGCIFDGVEIWFVDDDNLYQTCCEENRGYIEMKNLNFTCADAGACTFDTVFTDTDFVFRNIGTKQLDDLWKLWVWNGSVSISNSKIGAFEDGFGQNTSCWYEKDNGTNAHDRLMSIYIGYDPSVWNMSLSTGSLNVTNCDCEGLNIQALLVNNDTSGDFYIHDSKLFSLNPLYPPKSLDANNVWVWEVRFDNGINNWILPFCVENGYMKAHRYSWSGNSVLYSNCTLVGEHIIYPSVNFNANGNELYCDDEYIFGLNPITDNWFCCLGSVVVYDGGAKFSNAVLNKTPLSALIHLSDGGTSENITMTPEVAWITPELYPDWIGWNTTKGLSVLGEAYNYSFLKVVGENSQFTNVSIYDTFVFTSPNNNFTGIRIVGCTGRLGSICDYESPAPTGYQAQYETKDLVYITGDVIGNAFVNIKELTEAIVAIFLVFSACVLVFKVIKSK